MCYPRTSGIGRLSSPGSESPSRFVTPCRTQRFCCALNPVCAAAPQRTRDGLTTCHCSPHPQGTTTSRGTWGRHCPPRISWPCKSIEWDVHRAASRAPLQRPTSTCRLGTCCKAEELHEYIQACTRTTLLRACSNSLHTPLGSTLNRRMHHWSQVHQGTRIPHPSHIEKLPA